MGNNYKIAATFPYWIAYPCGMAKYKNIVPFGLRLQPELKAALEKSAHGKPKWSLNSEITERLEVSFTIRHELADFTDGELIDELIRRWGRERVHIQLGKPE